MAAHANPDPLQLCLAGVARVGAGCALAWPCLAPNHLARTETLTDETTCGWPAAAHQSRAGCAPAGPPGPDSARSPPRDGARRPAAPHAAASGGRGGGWAAGPPGGRRRATAPAAAAAAGQLGSALDPLTVSSSTKMPLLGRGSCGRGPTRCPSSRPCSAWCRPLPCIGYWAVTAAQQCAAWGLCEARITPPWRERTCSKSWGLLGGCARPALRAECTSRGASTSRP